MMDFLKGKNIFRAIAVTAAVLSAAASAQAEVGKVPTGALESIEKAVPIFGQIPAIKDPHGTKAVLFFDHTKRFDLNIMAEFAKDCSDFSGVQCFYADVSGGDKEDLYKAFSKSVQGSRIYLVPSSPNTPYAIFLKENKPLGSITKEENIALYTPVYLAYLAGRNDNSSLQEMLDAADKAENYKKIVPRMNFVLMLAQKGELSTAIKELDKVDAEQLDAKGKLLLGQTYLRLKSIDKAAELFASCSDDQECRFYEGVTAYLGGDNPKARGIFNSLKNTYPDKEKLNFYLDKINESYEDAKDAE